METEIELFLALAEELHFGRAAQRLGISPARASQTVTKLEERVGYKLFSRTTRRVELTPSGAKLETRLRPLWRQLRDALSGTEVSGTLNISFMTPGAARLLGDISAAFHEQNPDCTVHLHDIRVTEIATQLRSGRIDLAFGPFPFEADDFMSGPILVTEPRGLVVPVGHPLAGHDEATLEDLALGPLLQSAADLPESYQNDRSPLLTPSGKPIPRGPITTTTVQETLHAVAMGRGIAQISALAARFIDRTDVKFLPLVDAPPLEWGFIWLATSGDPRPSIFSKFATKYVAHRGQTQ